MALPNLRSFGEPLKYVRTLPLPQRLEGTEVDKFVPYGERVPAYVCVVTRADVVGEFEYPDRSLVWTWW